MNIIVNAEVMADKIDSVLRGHIDVVEEAMAQTFHGVVLSNFGLTGVDRPIDWANLSPKYAKRMGRTHATLEVSGALKQAVHQAGNQVYAMKEEIPYVLAHQYGYAPNNLSKRPYFPIDEQGNGMPFTLSLLREMAQLKLDEVLR